MKRRDFLKKAGLTAAATIAAPYILPAGRLFAPTGTRIANHVVVCLFAGGVRNLDSIQKKDGNLMRGILNGTESISSDILPGMTTLPANPATTPLENFGTLYKEFRYAQGPAGHYAGHTVAMTGKYANTSINLNQAPEYPTIFELYRKHSSPSKNALNAWWVSDSLGPYPALNYSTYPGYGSMYGANYIQPASLISQEGYNVLGNSKQFTTGEESAALELKDFLNKNFSNQYNSNDAGIGNPVSDASLIRGFIDSLLTKAAAGQLNDPWSTGGIMNSDMFNIYFAEEIMKEFTPELMVVNMQDVDICHFDFTSYADNLRKADWAVAHLWNTIQSTPGMTNDTILIVVPEHGRNLQPNTVIDAYGRYAIDHTAIDNGGDQTSREIFCLVAGPPSLVHQNNPISTVKGESVDIVPTVARVLGFDTEIPNYISLDGQHLADAFKV